VLRGSEYRPREHGVRNDHVAARLRAAHPARYQADVLIVGRMRAEIYRQGMAMIDFGNASPPVRPGLDLRAALAQTPPPPVPNHPIGRCVRVLGVTASEDAKTAGFEYVELALQDLLRLSDAEFAQGGRFRLRHAQQG